jgi:hypothetical protein
MRRFDLHNQIKAGTREACRRIGLPRRTSSSVLVQEEAGIHVGISPDLPEAARHAASVMLEKYRRWLKRGRYAAWGRYKRHHFVIAVGGGNTLKAQYRAMVDNHHADIDWLNHVRFFFLEESSGEKNWASAEQSLVMNFIVPLAKILIKTKGLRAVATDLKLAFPADEDDVIDQMIANMINPINLAENPEQAGRLDGISLHHQWHR